MMIYYKDGRTAEGLLLSMADSSLRMQVKGATDVETFTKVNGIWVSESCEPVVLRLGDKAPLAPPHFSLDDFICPAPLAAQLVDRLMGGSELENLKPAVDAEMDYLYWVPGRCTMN